jgi:hypothetical protein
LLINTAHKAQNFISTATSKTMVFTIYLSPTAINKATYKHAVYGTRYTDIQTDRQKERWF